MSDPTYPPNQNVQRLDRLTNWLLGLILVIPFLISFGALRDLAAHNAISYPWLYPIMIDGGLIIFKAIALRSSLRGKRDSYAWAMAVLATVISVYLNIVHVPPTLPSLGLARFMAALPPLVILVSFIAVSRRIEESARHDKAIFSYQQIQQAINDKRRQANEMSENMNSYREKMEAQINRLMEKKEALQMEIADLQRTHRTEKRSLNGGNTDSISHAREIRRGQKEKALQTLLAYLEANPDAEFSDMAEKVGRTKRTVRNYISELSDAGQLHKNGHGWEVLSTE
jgi:cell fate (sporulation/competence/biofilm development) regulator YlbF (YheA/YmcA/DUF963 family)